MQVRNTGFRNTGQVEQQASVLLTELKLILVTQSTQGTDHRRRPRKKTSSPQKVEEQEDAACLCSSAQVV